MHLYPKRAILDGAEAEVFKLLSYGATAEQWADWLRSPLEHAAARGNLDLVNRLLKAGASGRAGWRGCRGRTLLDAAALGGNPDVVSALLRAGCRPDVTVVSVSSRRSALHVAVTCGHDAVAKTLIAAGVDVHLIDPDVGVGPLHIAARGGQEQLVRELLIGGASPNDLADNDCTPLHEAAEFGRENIVSALLISSVIDKDAVDVDGYSPLMRACENYHLSTVHTLLAAGADAAFRGVDQTAALDLAASLEDVRIMTALLEHGADVHARDNNGRTALHQAAQGDPAAAIDILLDAGADVEASTATGDTPLLVAAEFSCIQSTLALLLRGANINELNYQGETVLHASCKHIFCEGVADVVDLLLRWGASETAVDKYGNTPADRLEKNALHGFCLADK